MTDVARAKSLFVSEPSSSEGFPAPKDAPTDDNPGETFLTLLLAASANAVKRRKP